MLRFNNFPPTAAGDVQLTVEGKRALKRRIAEGERAVALTSNVDRRRSREIDLANALYNIATALGHVVVSSIEVPTKEVAAELIAPLLNDYRDNVVIDPNVHRDFPSGLKFGVDEALSLIEREAESKGE